MEPDDDFFIFDDLNIEGRWETECDIMNQLEGEPYKSIFTFAFDYARLFRYWKLKKNHIQEHKDDTTKLISIINLIFFQ